jgi:hypothetical protein
LVDSVLARDDVACPGGCTPDSVIRSINTQTVIDIALISVAGSISADIAAPDRVSVRRNHQPIDGKVSNHQRAINSVAQRLALNISPLLLARTISL